MFCDAGMDMELPLLRSLLQWLRGFYRPDEGVFRVVDPAPASYERLVTAIYRGNVNDRGNVNCRGSDYWKTSAKVAYPVLRYQLWHTVEDDWLTYRLTKIAAKMAASDAKKE